MVIYCIHLKKDDESRWYAILDLLYCLRVEFGAAEDTRNTTLTMMTF